MTGPPSGFPVALNVYDMSYHNQYLYWCGLGIFHTGVQVHDLEYSFGGHDFPNVSGIFSCLPREAPGGAVFRERIPMGETTLTAPEVAAMASDMGREYEGLNYHLLERNCNHFANDFATQLTGNSAPSWINRLAYLATLVHCVLPVGWVPPLSPPTVVPECLPTAAPGSAQGFRRRDPLRDASARQKLLSNGNAPAPDLFEGSSRA